MCAVACTSGGSAPAPTPRTPAEFAAANGGRVLGENEWAGVPEGGVGPSPAPRICATADAPDCRGKWLTEQLAIGNEGGQIDGVVSTPSEIVVVVRAHHSCGAYLPEPQWKLWVPEPVRPVRVVDVGPSVQCNGQP
jgi:hypothetical protein